MINGQNENYLINCRNYHSSTIMSWFSSPYLASHSAMVFLCPLTFKPKLILAKKKVYFGSTKVWTHNLPITQYMDNQFN